ncbi:hypothetical protein D1P53_005955 [Cryptococcus gattii VGV]|nr:hypothetical protein D1P53_005955 [Cryptococcus gattii VGV]
MQSTQVHPAPVCKKPPRSFISSHYQSADEVDDGIFRVVLITSGSVASIKVPDIVGALVKVNNNALDILPSNLPSNGPPSDRFRLVATKASSTYFYSQDDVDNSVRSALNLSDGQTGEDFGVRVGTDEDE